MIKTDAVLTPGKYWIGDLCYVLPKEWSEVCDGLFDPKNPCINGTYQLKDSREIAILETAYGDGVYYDNENNQYSVDAGIIGCILLDTIKNASLSDLILGSVVHITEPFIPTSVDGKLIFDRIIIDTGDEEESDYYSERCDYM